MSEDLWDNLNIDPVRDMREFIEQITKGCGRWEMVPGYCLRCKMLVDVRCPTYLGKVLSFIALCIRCGNPTVRLLGRG